MTKRPRGPRVLATRRQAPSTLTTLPLLRVGYRMMTAIGLFGWGLLPKIWRGRRRVAQCLLTVFWRGTTLLSLAYLVYDRIYETSATISASASDPKSPFTFPFTITNNSHMFSINNVRWNCHAISIAAENNIRFDNTNIIVGSRSTIPPGQVLNIDCNVVGSTSRIIRFNDLHFTEAVLEIDLLYDANLFGVIPMHRRPPATRFTWIASASNPQWVRGDFAQ